MWRGIKGRGTGGRGCRACAARAASLGGTYAAGRSRAGADGERPGALADAARALGPGRACGPGPDGTAGDAGRQGPRTRAPGCRGRSPWSLPSAPGGGERETEPRAAAARAPSPEWKGRQPGPAAGAGRVRGTAGIPPEITGILSSFLPKVKTKASCGRWPLSPERRRRPQRAARRGCNCRRLLPGSLPRTTAPSAAASGAAPRLSKDGS